MANQESGVAEFLEGSINSISQFILDIFVTLGIDVHIETIEGVTICVLCFTVAVIVNCIFDKKDRAIIVSCLKKINR